MSGWNKARRPYCNDMHGSMTLSAEGYSNGYVVGPVYQSRYHVVEIFAAHARVTGRDAFGYVALTLNPQAIPQV